MELRKGGNQHIYGGDRVSEENKTLIRRSVEEFWNTGDMAVVDELWGTSYIGHDPSGFHAGTLEEFKQNAKAIFAAFPDAVVIIDDLIAKGDQVVKRWTARGTHKGDFMGIPATGNKFEFTGIDIYRIAGGKIVECWSNSDSMGFMQQLGVIPPMGGEQ
jgi:steroid delta-isomerase-like uncharacterized protein